jgi:hypothetical protein
MVGKFSERTGILSRLKSTAGTKASHGSILSRERSMARHSRQQAGFTTHPTLPCAAATFTESLLV